MQVDIDAKDVQFYKATVNYAPRTKRIEYNAQNVNQDSISMRLEHVDHVQVSVKYVKVVKIVKFVMQVIMSVEAKNAKNVQITVLHVQDHQVIVHHVQMDFV